MSDKYIIKNCELICNGECPNSKTGYCQDCTDCPLKQIVEKCKEVNTKFYDSVHQRYLSPSKAKFAREIMDLLDIQEVE